jgi:hypothetical protein
MLANGDVLLRFESHCVQTAATRARRDLIATYFDRLDSESRIEAAIGLLGRFLETADFSRLRSDSPELAGPHTCRVRLHQLEDGTVQCRICRPS